MNHSAPRKALRIFGIVLVILLPVLLALWFAQIRAKAETGDQLRLFSRLALQKTELVIREADEARDKARLYQGEICSPQHQQYLLGIVRGLLYIDDLIYANGTHFSAPPRYAARRGGEFRPQPIPKSRISRFTTTAKRLSTQTTR